jgi:hypothetical protein
MLEEQVEELELLDPGKRGRAQDVAVQLERAEPLADPADGRLGGARPQAERRHGPPDHALGLPAVLEKSVQGLGERTLGRRPAEPADQAEAAGLEGQVVVEVDAEVLGIGARRARPRRGALGAAGGGSRVGSVRHATIFADPPGRTQSTPRPGLNTPPFPVDGMG